MQLYKRARLWPYVADHTAQLEAMGPTADGLDFTRDATTDYFTATASNIATNDAFVDRGGVTEKSSLKIDEARNIDLIFDYSEVELSALTALGVWGQQQMGRINQFNRTRDAFVIQALKNNVTGAGLAANQRSIAIADASNFVSGVGDTEKAERFNLVAHLVNVNLDLWNRGMDIYQMGGGTPGYQGVVHLVNSQALKALQTYNLADVPNGGTGIYYDASLGMGMIAGGGVVGANRVIIDHLMDNTITASGDEYLSISFPSGAVKGIMPRRGGMVSGYKYQTAAVDLSGNAQQDADNAGAARPSYPTPIRIMGQRYAYDIELFDKDLVIAAKAVVTAN
ncbi:MAG: hypothetical protein OXQ29_26330 [Rhodospirillaceae bacterium]|nr:hypothetical protein [Rhodospirillaceae bacterium]